jgi:hypothetical protein
VIAKYILLSSVAVESKLVRVNVAITGAIDTVFLGLKHQGTPGLCTEIVDAANYKNAPGQSYISWVYIVPFQVQIKCQSVHSESLAK